MTSTNDVENDQHAERDATSGRFLPGNSGFGGRPRGSRNRLGEAFLADLRATWAKHGTLALERCAVEEPAAFARIVATLLPDQVEIGVAGEFSQCQSLDDVADALLAEHDDDPQAALGLLDRLREAMVERIGRPILALPAPTAD